MRKEIIKGIFSPLDRFCHTSCAVKAQSLEAYVEAIRHTSIWPLETVHQKSNKEVVDSPGFLHWKATTPEGACYFCRSRLQGTHIAKIRTDILSYWEGLCLDCMDISKTKTGDLDSDYWVSLISKLICYFSFGYWSIGSRL